MDLKYAVEYSKNDRIDYPDIFTIDCGLDIVIPTQKLHAVGSWVHSNKNKRRKVVLKLSTWVGLSFGAMHYYGKLVVDGIDMEFDDKPNCTTSVDEKLYPLANWTYDLKIYRPLTQFEIDNDPDRWKYYKAGDKTDCFETIPELLEYTKEIIKLRFIGDWDFFIEHVSGRTEKLDLL